MKMTERAGEAIQGTGTRIKRRGLIAGAAALVAGLVAKRAAEESPVAADNGVWSFPYAGNTTAPGVAFSVVNSGSGGAIYASSNGVGIEGISAFSQSGHGVYGSTNAPAGASVAGVNGVGNAYGVLGYAGAGGVAVQGTISNTAGTGVRGIAGSGFPVVGSVQGLGSDTNINAGVTGYGTAGPGVQGQSTGGYGLVGFTSDTAGHAGLIGYASATGGIGLIGNAPGGAFGGGLAGVFNGDVAINGALRVYGSPKNAAVKHPDGSHRLLYCEESPESWFADYGKGKLVNGRADVKLDPDFAALVHSDDYLVFPVSHDPASRGLAIAAIRPDGFSVQEHAGGTSSGTFSYRVVAKRKDIGGERLAKVAPPPPMKPVLPFAVPETPEVKPPTRKP